MGCMELSSSCCIEINIHIDLRLVSQGISVGSWRKSSHLFCMMCNTGYLWSQWRGNGLHLELTPSYFAFLRRQQCSSCLVTVVLGILWCSIKHIEALFVFDWEHRIALHSMQQIRASSSAEGDVSCDFSSCCRTWGIFSSYSGDGHSKFHFVQRSLDSCLVRTDTSGI